MKKKKPIGPKRRGVSMEKEVLRKAVEAMIHTHTVCALATGTNDFVRCTPVEYNYVDHKFYIFSEGGLKFRALKTNTRVCLAIFDDKEQGLHSLQVTGRARMVESWSDEYNALLAYKQITETMKKLPEAMPLICVEPVEMDVLNSDFKRQGFDVRQHIEGEEWI